MDYSITAEQAKKLSESEENVTNSFLYRKAKLTIIETAKAGLFQIKLRANECNESKFGQKTSFDRQDHKVFKRLEKEGYKIDVTYYRHTAFEDGTEVVTISWD